MKIDFSVHIKKYQSITVIPDAWTSVDYKAILRRLEVGDISEIPNNELREMCQMAITDFEPDEAAKEVLMYLLDQDLNEGQIDNLAHEMVEEPMWEEFADMRCHEAIFNANELLYTAYNGKFPRPAAVNLTISVTPTKQEGKEWLDEPTEAFIMRLLAGGMDDHSTLVRLFGEQIAKGTLPEAANIIWKCHPKGKEGAAYIFEIIGSTYWLAAIKGVGTYQTAAYPDTVTVEA